MVWQIEVASKPAFPDVHADGVLADIRALGISGADSARSARLFFIDTDAAPADVERIARELLSDPVVEEFTVTDGRESAPAPPDGAAVIVVSRKTGVMDPVANSARAAIADMGIEVAGVRTARKYYLGGSLGPEVLATIASKILANDCIEDVAMEDRGPKEFTSAPPHEFKLIHVPVTGADDEELQTISRDGGLFLNLREMQTIKQYYSKLGRDPTDAELETIAQTWSEHCGHKTFRGTIRYNGRIIDNLLKSTIARVTEELALPWCISVFKDNAGIIEFDDKWNICFKVETHNHPSALEPYGGSATGIGGVIRDPMGTGLGARPILNTNVFCFAPPDYPLEKVPAGVLHPRRVMRGVVSGVRDYGNRMGIPTANGAIYFDDRYLGNPLVYCGNVGIMPRDKCFGEPRPGDLVILIGGRTGRDGIHGVTFASGELTDASESTFSHAVQIGNPIVEKKMVDILMEARDRDLYTAITDCGGGGLSSAVGEMGEEIGVEVDLETVPLKYKGLTHTEIWISEAQERMVIAVPPENESRVLSLFASEDVEATTIGKFNSTGRLQLRFKGNVVADLDMEFLHNGLPRYEREAVWQKLSRPEPELPEQADYTAQLLGILGSWNVCSKEWVIRQYDHEVQGASVIKPLVGAENDGPGDACVITPVYGSTKGIAVGCGMNPKYGDIDPYWMAASAIDEAVRNVVAVGANPARVSLLDNFCWGNCDKPDRLGALVRAAEGCRDVGIAYRTPFISGKDSLNNEFAGEDGKSTAIPPSLLISAMAIVDDVRQCVTMDAKEPGNRLYIVGVTRAELGGSHYLALAGHVGNSVPQVDLALAPRIFQAVAEAIRAGIVRACHDLSEGGLAVAAAEMAFAGGLGMKINLQNLPRSDDLNRDDVCLFSESNTRFLIEVRPEDREKFEKLAGGVPMAEIGEITGARRFEILGLGGAPVVSADIENLKSAWKKPLAW